jgi:tetratricopeptide (TPR) repeat protein
MDDLDNALRHYMQAVEINDRLAEAWVNIGMVYEKLNNYKKAMPFILEAVRVEPDNMDFQYLLGDVYVELEDYDKALAIYEMVSEKKPETKDIWYDLSGVYWEMDAKMKALETLEKGLLVNPKNCKIHFRRFEFAYEQGRTKMSYQYLNQAMELDSKTTMQLISEIALLNTDGNLLDIIEDYKRKNEEE